MVHGWNSALPLGDAPTSGKPSLAFLRRYTELDSDSYLTMHACSLLIIWREIRDYHSRLLSLLSICTRVYAYICDPMYEATLYAI